MNEELQAAEVAYAPRFAEAGKIPDEHQRRARVDGIRNSFGTKQSMIRKKYGVRLRERRTKAVIQAERDRMGIKEGEKEKRKSKQSSPAANADGTPRPTAAAGSGWTAANTPKPNAVWEEHDAKRRRMDGSGGYQTPYKSVADDTPSRRALSVSEIGGGLAGASATAAMHDPTLPPGASQPSRVYEQSGARVEIHEPSAADRPGSKGEPRSATATPSGSDAGGGYNGRGSHRGAPSADMEVVAVEPGDSSSDDDEDIPSTLPAHMRRSVGSGGLLQHQ